MTDSKIFLDTAPFIYLLDNDENFGDKTNRILSDFLRKNNKFVSSVITCTEYLVVPYRTNNRSCINAFWELIEDCFIDLFPITQPIAEKAAEIRAAYKFKTMDSLQLAVACMEECELFLTNDKQLRQFQEIRCVTVEEWEV
ncbi:MAG: PIN domain-containing protein [Selenomonadaceae bacterium]|nr:PIN domain-containing protein [Selenomonadaceae bacterium]MBQ1914162.1 PIN domain-containing protein [Selenomonadaceae bacterium]